MPTLLSILGPLLKIILEVFSAQFFKIFTAPDTVVQDPPPILDHIDRDHTSDELVGQFGMLTE
jgi:hypothetical protein